MVTIHVDDETRVSVIGWVSKSKFKQAIKIRNLLSTTDEPWQVQKMNLILDLSGLFDFFVDADTRWNGPLSVDISKGDTVFFFVEEFKLANHPVFSKMISQQDFQQYNDASMWNTSFFCFSGFSLTQLQKSEILKLREQIVSYAKVSIRDSDVSASTIRISEQLAISLASSKWPVLAKAVKEVDGYKDGSFLESSYFGATGTHF
jgi:hypothetical protein